MSERLKTTIKFGLLAACLILVGTIEYETAQMIVGK